MATSVVVGDGLSLALGWCRLLGVSPLHMDPSSQRSLAARAHSLYRFIFIIMLNIMCITPFILNLQWNGNNPQGRDAGGPKTEFLSWLIHMALIVFAVDFALWTGRERMSRIYHQLKETEQAAFKLGFIRDQRKWRERKRALVFMLAMSTEVGLQIMKYYHLYEITVMGKKECTIYIVYLYISYFLLMLIGVALTFELVAFIYAFQAAVEVLNDKLAQMLKTFQKTRPLSTTEENHLRFIASVYISIGDNISQFVKADGGLMLVIFISYYVNFIGTAYLTIDNVAKLERRYFSDDREPIMSICWCVIKFAFMIIMVEPCHWFQKEVEKMRVLVAKLMYRTQAAGEPIPLVVHILCKQLQLDAPGFTLLGVCTITRSFLITVISAVAACLMLLVQYRAET